MTPLTLTHDTGQLADQVAHAIRDLQSLQGWAGTDLDAVERDLLQRALQRLRQIEERLRGLPVAIPAYRE
jgi:pyruvate carboxylase